MSMMRVMTGSINHNSAGGNKSPAVVPRPVKQNSTCWPISSTDASADPSRLSASPPKRVRALSDSSQRSHSRDSISSSDSSACNSLFDKPALGHSPNSSVSSTAPTVEEIFSEAKLTSSPITYHSLGDSALTPTPFSTGNRRIGDRKATEAETSTPVSHEFAHINSQSENYNIHPAMKPWSMDQASGPDASERPEAMSGHNRSESYQSSLSSASINSSAWGGSNSGYNTLLGEIYGGAQTACMSPISKNQLPGSGAYTPTTARSRKFPRSPVPRTSTQPTLTGNSKPASFDDAFNLVNSLSGLQGPNPYGILPGCLPGYPQPYVDPQAFAATMASFGNPLLDFYGLSPELLAARSTALAQLAVNGLGAGTNGPDSADEASNPGNKKTNLYKTELCRSWEEKGSCRYGSKCQFAHGMDELRSVNRHPKFKTEICRTFWLHGSCPYGKRCCFLHTTATDSGAAAPQAGNSPDPNQSSNASRNAHDPPTSRLQQRTSTGLSNAIEKLATLSLSTYLKSSPQLKSAPPTRSQSELGHSRSSSTSRSSEHSSAISGMRIPIGSRFGAKDQVPAQDAPGPRSRLERLRPTGDFSDSSSLPGTSAASTTRYSPLLDPNQPPHSAFSDISSVLSRSPSRHAAKAHSAHGDEEIKWPSSRLSSGTSVAVA